MANYVIVPLDGSKLAEEALPMGISLAQEAGSEGMLQLVQVLPESVHFSAYFSDEDMSLDELHRAFRASAEAYLIQMKAKLVEAGVFVEIQLLDGHAGEVLAKLANREKASYLVMCTHGRGGISRWALGSVADKVLQLIESPLIIMRPQNASDAPITDLSGGTLNLSDLPQLGRIVLPLDGTPFAEQVLPHAKELARAYGAELLLLRCVSAVRLGMIGADVAVLEARLYETNRNEARDYLERIKLNLEVEGFKVSIEVCGMPATDAILAYAAKTKADLIAMCTHARGAIGRMIMGSVADGIIRSGQLPVLVIRGQTKES